MFDAYREDSRDVMAFKAYKHHLAGGHFYNQKFLDLVDLLGLLSKDYLHTIVLNTVENLSRFG